MARLITRARRAADKGRYVLERPGSRGGTRRVSDRLAAADRPQLSRARPRMDVGCGSASPGALWLGVELLDRRLRCKTPRAPCRRSAKSLELPQVAAGDVHMHRRSRRALQDVLTAIRTRNPLARGGRAPVSERRAVPAPSRCACASSIRAELLEQTLAIAERCTFNLDELRYEYPEEIVPAGETPTQPFARPDLRGLRQALAARRAACRARGTSSTSCG